MFSTLFTRSNNTDNGKLAKIRVRKSLKITSQVKENTHPRSGTVQHLLDGHQLMKPMKKFPHVTTTAFKRSLRANLSRLGQTSKSKFLILPRTRKVFLLRDKFRSPRITRTMKYPAACPTPPRVLLPDKSCGVEGGALSSSTSGEFSRFIESPPVFCKFGNVIETIATLTTDVSAVGPLSAGNKSLGVEAPVSVKIVILLWLRAHHTKLYLSLCYASVGDPS